MNTEKILADLKKVCESVPQYCEAARNDADLEKLKELKEFQALMLQSLDKALRTRPENAPEIALLRYSRACYRARAGRTNDEILADLKKAFAAKPELKEQVHKDIDLAPLLDQEEFKKLVFGP